MTGAPLVRERGLASVPPASSDAKSNDHPPSKWAFGLPPESPAEQHLEPSRPESLCGRIIEGKYRIDALIGRGGMGAVFRAENIRIGKPFAMKVLIKGHGKGSESERRFEREARIAGSLGHPHIVEVFDFGTLENGVPYQIMELLEGQSLAERIELEGALPIDEMLDYAEQILSALAAAHGHGIVHRDLKPANVFLHRRGGTTIAKLLDFGLSKSMAGDATLSLTLPGVVLGTPYYLSPEQARGDRHLDHRVDIWAMGVLLYESLTGVLPFKADAYHAVIAQILTRRPQPPTEIRPQLPRPIEDIVLRALAFDPADRFASAEEMLHALRVARRALQCERPAFRGLPELPALAVAEPADATLRELPISHIPMDAEDPTEVGVGIAFGDVDVACKRGS